MALLEVVKYEGPGDILAWKHPEENFTTMSQLIVHDTQEAVFFKNGQALDTFIGGKYTLSTDKIPILTKILNIPFGKKTPFTCGVYFINKTVAPSLKWGTDQPISMEDPRYGIFVKVRANGYMNVKVGDGRKFLLKMVGQVSSFESNTLQNYFRGVMMTKIKNKISEYMIKGGVSFLDISAYLSEISDSITAELAEDFAEYGLTLINCLVNAITVPDEDYAKLKQIKEQAAMSRTMTDAETYEMIKKGEAMAAARKAQGFSYQDERQFDVLEGAAKNQGQAGGMMGTGMGLGMGVAMGGIMGQSFGNMAQSMQPQPPQTQAAAQGSGKCGECGTALAAGAKFCSGCGAKVATAAHCSECGAKLNAGAKFCGECGAKV